MVEKPIEPQLDQIQNGFRKGRCNHDHIFTIKQILERTEDTNEDTRAAFDLEKAFDEKATKENLWNRNIDRKLRQILLTLRRTTRIVSKQKTWNQKNLLQSNV